MQKGSKKRILVVEDDLAVQVMMSRLLEANGFEVIVVKNVSEALDFVEKTIPHLVILDLVLEQEQGFEYLEKHRMAAQLKEIPVMVHSMMRDRESIFKASSLGVCDYILKPLNPHQLIGKVRKALKDVAFQAVVIDPERPLSVRLKANGRIKMVGPGEIVLEAPVRVAEGAQVSIQSPLISQMGVEKSVFQGADERPHLVDSKIFSNKISVAGIDGATAAKIRKVLEDFE